MWIICWWANANPSKGTMGENQTTPPSATLVSGGICIAPDTPTDTYSNFNNHLSSLKLTKLRYWPWNNFEVRLWGGWDPRESKDFIRWDEGRAHTESLPSPMSEKVMNGEKSQLRRLTPCTLYAHQTLNWGSPRGTHQRPQQSRPFMQYTKHRFCLPQTCPQSPITFPEINWR